jgi:hypothetical protein
VKFKPHINYLLFILILVLFIAGPIANPNNSKQGDWRNSDTPAYHFIQHYIVDGGSFPLWDHYTFSGRPLFGFGMPLLHPVAILFSFLFNAYATLNFLIIFHLLLAGIGMYVLTNEVFANKKAAVLAATIYLLSPYLILSGLSHPFWIYGLSYIPLELFLAIKAVHSKNYIFWSVLLGLTGGIHFLSGGVIQWYYAIPFVAFYVLFSVFNKNWKQRAVKAGIILFIFFYFTFSLAAIRLLPGQEHTSFTNRGTGLPVEEIIRVGHVSMNNFVDTFVWSINPETKAGSNKYGQVGFAGLALLLFGLYSFFRQKDYKKNTFVIFLVVSALLVIIFASGRYLDLLYNIPGVSSQRGLDRSLIIYVVIAALLVSLGYTYLEKKWKDNTPQKQNILFIIVTGLVIIGMLVPVYAQHQEFKERFVHYSVGEQNSLFQYMAQDKGIFRFHVNEVRGIDWNNFLGPSIPLQLESIYGTYGGGWDSRYFHQYLGATFSAPAKLWGMTNVKYIVSAQELQDENYEFIKQFNDLPLETIHNKAYTNTGYLYENKKFIERAKTIPAAVLIAGQEDITTRVMYSLLTHPNFDPAQTLLIRGKEHISEYTLTELKTYNAIILVQGSTTGTTLLLQQYLDQGGLLLPNIVEGATTVTNEDFINLFNTFNTFTDTQQATITSYYKDTPNKMIIDAGKGWLFISEKYTLYPGWTAHVNGKKTNIELANGVLSAIYLPENNNNVIFEYKPKSFVKGLRITILSLLVLLIYTGYSIKKKYFKQRREHSEQQPT